MGKFAILCSGGDSSGMNAAIRSFTRVLLSEQQDVLGIYRGYQGLIEEEFISLSQGLVGNIIQRGGTILKSSRCPSFHDPQVRAAAAQVLQKHGIDGLAVIGGDGSFRGALALHTEHQISLVGIPGTIDNDIAGTDYTIGHETAVQNALEAVDKIRDTALSHDRVFLVEVMGRNSSELALRIALCAGAEAAILPGEVIDYSQLAHLVERGIKRGKKSSIFIVAEGDHGGARVYEIKQHLACAYKIEAHASILGHIQRGGAPVAKDRFIATLMGARAAQALLTSVLSQQPVALVTAAKAEMINLTPLSLAVRNASPRSEDQKNLLSILSS